MPLILETAPENDPVTMDEVKEHLRVDFGDEDALIAGFIKAATQRLDGRDGSLGRCLITQTWKLTLDRFENEVVIPLPPCQSIDAITYIDPDGATQTLAPTEYQVFALGSVEGAKLRPAFGKSWPSIRNVPEAVTITFTAGFGDDPDDIPEPIRTAIKLRVGHLFEHRGSAAIGSGFIARTSDEAEELIRNHKTWSF
jgi:uncharacterized phiE125 gp8 family phage protein